MKITKKPALFIGIALLAVAGLILFKMNGMDVRQEFAHRVGETIHYEIRFGRLPFGEARFTALPVTNLKGAKVNVLTFETRSAKFSDVEKIYSNLYNYLPLRVERDISMLFVKEKILEEYDQANFVLGITKSKGDKVQQTTIKKDGPIHNAILLPYFVRGVEDLAVGWSFKARLPTQDFEIRLTSMAEEVTVPAGTFTTYKLESIPKKFEIWISADERRIPVKIKGIGKIIGYTFLMKEYTPG